MLSLEERWEWRQTKRVDVVQEMGDMVAINKEEEMELGGRGRVSDVGFSVFSRTLENEEAVFALIASWGEDEPMVRGAFFWDGYHSIVVFLGGFLGVHRGTGVLTHSQMKLKETKFNPAMSSAAQAASFTKGF